MKHRYNRVRWRRRWSPTPLRDRGEHRVRRRLHDHAVPIIEVALDDGADGITTRAGHGQDNNGGTGTRIVGKPDVNATCGILREQGRKPAQATNITIRAICFITG